MNASDVLNRITKAKRSQARLLGHVLRCDEILGQKIQWCGSWLHFREWLQSGDSSLINANFCKKHLLCQACAVRRAAKMNEAYLPKVESVVEAYTGKLVPAMVTLTMRNGPDLMERLQSFKLGWKRMLEAKRKSTFDGSKNLSIQWNKVHGSLRAIEVTMGKGGWHVHCHCFVLLTDFIDREKLSDEWRRFTGDSFIVDARKCRHGIKAGLLEVLKYSCKFSSMNPPQALEVHQTFQGVRMIDPQGVLRGVPEPDIDSDDISGKSGPYRDFIATWIASQDKYRIEYVDDAPPAPPVVPPSPRPLKNLPPLPPLKLRGMSRTKAMELVKMNNRKTDRHENSRKIS